VVRIKEIPIGDTAVPGRGCKGRAAQHQLVHHELAVVLAERALDRPVAGVGRIRAAGPLPDDAEGVVEVAGARRDLPFHLGRQMFCRPARKRIRLVIADMADRPCWVDRLQAAERHDLPIAVDLAPMAGRLPLLALDSGEAIHQPQRRGRIAAVLHEGEPFGIGDEIARQPYGPDQGPVRGFLIVEMKAVVAVADAVDALVERRPLLAAMVRGREAPDSAVLA